MAASEADRPIDELQGWDAQEARFIRTKEDCIVNVADLEGRLVPVVASLAPTSLGTPKTQSVVGRHLDVFLSMREVGLTLQAIADGLNVRGARTKKGAEFTAASLG